MLWPKALTLDLDFVLCALAKLFNRIFRVLIAQILYRPNNLLAELAATPRPPVHLLTQVCGNLPTLVWKTTTFYCVGDKHLSLDEPAALVTLGGFSCKQT